MPKGRGEEGSALDIVERFDTYEDYLDSQLTPTDLGAQNLTLIHSLTYSLTHLTHSSNFLRLFG